MSCDQFDRLEFWVRWYFRSIIFHDNNWMLNGLDCIYQYKMLIFYVANSPPCRPPFFLVVKKKKWSDLKKFLQIGLKSLSKKLMGRRSSLHEDFVRVKTLMGLERFEVENFLIWKKYKRCYWPRRVSNQKLLRYDWRPTHRLQLYRGDFCESKPLWV